MLVRYFAALFVAGIGATNAFVVTEPAVAWKSITPGWNLGNTLDGIPTEGSWSPAVTPDTFDDIKASGFKSVRIPVTFGDHFVSGAPDYAVNATWLTRVEAVVDMALARGFWVLVNVHHDSWEWMDITTATDYWGTIAKFEALWKQIAAKLNQKSEHLIFECLNEPVGAASEANGNLYNDLNLRFLNIVRNSGGYNANRITSLPSLNMNAQNAINWFKVPATQSGDKWTLQVHFYDPWDFISNWWGHTFWGSADDKALMTATLTTLAGNFTNVPILIGEFGVSGLGNIVEKAAGWVWHDTFVRLATKLNIPVVLWDNGGDYFNRPNHVWRDVTVKNIIVAASQGLINTIPDNGNGTVWIPVGKNVTEQKITLNFNGNTLKSVTSGTGTVLKSGSQYVASSTGVTLTASYLSSLPTSLGALGTVIIKSSQGADLEIDIRRYSKPTITTSIFNSPNPASDLYIPTTFNGAKLATVKAIKSDGLILKDDWTIYLGPLQQGRINWGDFDWADNNLIVRSSLLNIIKNSGKNVTLTFEFWPRTDQNNNVGVNINY